MGLFASMGQEMVLSMTMMWHKTVFKHTSFLQCIVSKSIPDIDASSDGMLKAAYTH